MALEGAVCDVGGKAAKDPARQWPLRVRFAMQVRRRRIRRDSGP